MLTKLWLTDVNVYVTIAIQEKRRPASEEAAQPYPVSAAFCFIGRILPRKAHLGKRDYVWLPFLRRPPHHDAATQPPS